MNLKVAISSLLFLFLLTTLSGQLPNIPPGEYFSRDDSSWYFRKTGITQYLIAIREGQMQKVIQQADKHDGDAEADFLRAVAYAHQGQPKVAMSFVRASLQKELPLGRYLAGMPQLLAPLMSLPAFQQLKEDAPNPLVHGPMIGRLSSRSATFWCRTDGPQTVRVEVSADRSFQKKMVAESTTAPIKECTAQIEMKGLKAATSYYYRIFVNKQSNGNVYRFSTSPEEGKSSRFTIAFGGGAAYIPWHHRMWSTIHANRPDALFLLGDNVYIDYPEHPEIQQYCYYRRQSEPHFRMLTGQTPTYAIWDDHDFGDNDEFGTPDPAFPVWKPKVLDLFKNQWVDPGYGGSLQLPGVFFKITIADVDFFFLDGRYYRQPSEVGVEHEEPLSMLGAAQKQWLKEQLLQSTATFKVLISPVPWSFDAKPPMEGRIDTWGGYREERTEIFDFLADNGIEGVFLLSADRHRSDIWKIERPNGYPLFEFESSKLTNTHTHPVMPGSVYGYNDKCSFGKLVFDTTAGDPHVEYQIVNIDNVVVKRFVLKRSELTHG